VGKRESHRRELIALFDEFIATGNDQELCDYIASNSNLPGPRGNLELAEAFGDVVRRYASDESPWSLCQTMAEISPEKAPVNDPRELIPFCGAVGIGTLGAACPTLFAEAMTTLRTLANDARWRMREAVRMGLHRLIAARRQETLDVLAQWTAKGSLLEMRAAAAGVAEPTLLEDGETARAASELHETILGRTLEIENRKSDEFKVLRKGLGYTLSLVVQALPEEGFAFMRRLIATQDKDVLWIVKKNLKKNRLTKNFPAQVESIKSSLGAAK
jgi:hypothetical protein